MAKLFFPSQKSPFPSLPLFPSPTPSLPFSLSTHHHHKRSKLSLKPISSNFKNGSTPPSGIECPVPLDQQPIIEYQNLSTSFPFSWASGDFVEYISRSFVTGLSFALLVGLPVSWFGSIGSEPDPVKLVLGSASSGLFAVTLVVVRMYLGWAYVGNRLLSATVEYEETGWYDGQIWVKTAEVLARDRLLGSFQRNLRIFNQMMKKSTRMFRERRENFINLWIAAYYINWATYSEAGPEQIEKFPCRASNIFISMHCSPCKL